MRVAAELDRLAVGHDLDARTTRRCSRNAKCSRDPEVRVEVPRDLLGQVDGRAAGSLLLRRPRAEVEPGLPHAAAGGVVGVPVRVEAGRDACRIDEKASCERDSSGVSIRTSGPWTKTLGPVRAFGGPCSRASAQTLAAAERPRRRDRAARAEDLDPHAAAQAGHCGRRCAIGSRRAQSSRAGAKASTTVAPAGPSARREECATGSATCRPRRARAPRRRSGTSAIRGAGSRSARSRARAPARRRSGRARSARASRARRRPSSRRRRPRSRAGRSRGSRRRRSRVET